MTPPSDASTGRLARLPVATRWGLLVVVSVAIAGALEAARVPAALLLGPMIAGMAIGANGGAVRIPRLAYLAAQAIVGCLIARVVLPSTMREMAHDWPTFLGGVLSVIAASVALGWLLARLRVLPGTTAVWGSFPGAATVMTLMAEGLGADARLVALMQYLRVVFSSPSRRRWRGSGWDCPPPAAAPIVWLPPVAWPSWPKRSRWRPCPP